MSIFDIVINIVESFIGIAFIYFVLQKNKKYLSLILVTIICAFITTIHNYYSLPELSLSFFWFMSCVLYAYYLSRNSLILNLFLALFVSVLAYSSVSITMLLTSLFYSFPFYDGEAYYFLAIISKLINAILVFISVKYIQKYHLLKTKKLKYILLSILLLDILYSSIADFVIYNLVFNQTIIIILISLNLLSLTLAIVFLETKKEQQELLELQKSKIRLENQQSIIELNKQNIDSMNKWKHDMKHIFNSISYNININNIGEVKKIIEQYSVVLNQKAISVQTGNDLLDYILLQKNQSIIANEIDIFAKYKDCLCPLEDTDFFVIMGNLLDNAIENCHSIQQKQINISIGIYHDYYYIKIQNSILQPILKKNPHLMTTKEDSSQHGKGINSIKLLVTKYKGKISFNDKDSLFTVSILIPIN